MSSHAPVMSAPARPSIAGPWTSWALVYAAVTAGVLSCEIALSMSIEGAATPAEQRWVLWAALLTGVTLPAGLAGHVAERRSGDPAHGARVRGRLAVAMGAFALLVGSGRVASHANRLFAHIDADADEPLTMVSLGLQLMIAMAATAALVAYAAHERGRAHAAVHPHP